MGLDCDYAGNGMLTSLWAEHGIPSFLADFIYRLFTNRLPIGATLAHYRNVSAACTFCLEKYQEARKRELGEAEGPISIERESQRHLFFEGPRVLKSG